MAQLVSISISTLPLEIYFKSMPTWCVVTIKYYTALIVLSLINIGGNIVIIIGRLASTAGLQQCNASIT